MSIICLVAAVSPARMTRFHEEPDAASDYILTATGEPDAPDELGPIAQALDLDKSWHVLHYLFSGQFDTSEEPQDFLLSGELLGEDDDVRLHDAAATVAIHTFLSGVDARKLTSEMDFEKMVALDIYPLFSVPSPAEADAWRGDIQIRIAQLQVYVGQAAGRGNGLLICVS